MFGYLIVASQSELCCCKACDCRICDLHSYVSKICGPQDKCKTWPYKANYAKYYFEIAWACLDVNMIYRIVPSTENSLPITHWYVLWLHEA